MSSESKNRIQRIKMILQKSSIDREMAELIEISQEIQDITFIKQFIGSNTPDLIKMCRYVVEETHDAGSIIFKQGDKGDKFYLVISGGLEIYITSQDQNQNPNTTFSDKHQICVGKLGPGKSFGELALLFPTPRNATIITTEKSVFIVITKSVFQQFMKYQTNDNAMQIMQFYQESEFFKKFPMDLPEKVQMVSKTELRQLKCNDVIIHQNDEDVKFFFINKGLAKVYRKVKFKTLGPNGKFDLQNYESPTDLEIYNGCYKELNLELDEIYEGQYFCDYETLNNDRSQVTVISYTPTIILEIPKHDMHVLGIQILETLKKLAKPYPPDKKLRRIYLEGLLWNDYKSCLVKNYEIEKTNVKKLNDHVAFFSRNKQFKVPQIASLALNDDSFTKEYKNDDQELNFEKEIFGKFEEYNPKRQQKKIQNNQLLMKTNNKVALLSIESSQMDSSDAVGGRTPIRTHSQQSQQTPKSLANIQQTQNKKKDSVFFKENQASTTNQQPPNTNQSKSPSYLFSGSNSQQQSQPILASNFNEYVQNINSQQLGEDLQTVALHIESSQKISMQSMQDSQRTVGVTGVTGTAGATVLMTTGDQKKQKKNLKCDRKQLYKIKSSAIITEELNVSSSQNSNLLLKQHHQDFNTQQQQESSDNILVNNNQSIGEENEYLMQYKLSKQKKQKSEFQMLMEKLMPASEQNNRKVQSRRELQKQKNKRLSVLGNLPIIKFKEPIESKKQIKPKFNTQNSQFALKEKILPKLKVKNYY